MYVVRNTLVIYEYELMKTPKCIENLTIFYRQTKIVCDSNSHCELKYILQLKFFREIW